MLRAVAKDPEATMTSANGRGTELDRAEAAQHWRERLADDDAHAARVAFCRTAADAIAGVGEALEVGGYVLRDESAQSLSLVTRIGAALAQGCCGLLETGNAYAAAALVRQFVEVEYLLWTFADDAEDAARWLHASRSQLERRFRPAAMRERSDGRFRSEEYRAHCDHGGHPSPRGWFLLANTSIDPVRTGWVDLGQHLERAWRLLVDACGAIDYADVATTHVVEHVECTRATWHERDELAIRIARD